jgi:hypothetical protein
VSKERGTFQKISTFVILVLMDKENCFNCGTGLPYQLSVGAVLLDKEDRVMCHYFKDLTQFHIDAHDICVLMTETPEPDESLKGALNRGLLEEFGATGKILSFVGSQVVDFDPGLYKKELKGKIAEKTTVWFLVRLESIDESRRDKDAIEGKSEIKHIPLDECIQIFKKQHERINREEINCVSILERIKKHIENREI